MTNDEQSQILAHVGTTEAMDVKRMPMAQVLIGVVNRLDAYVGEAYRRTHERVARFLISLDDDDASDLLADVYMMLPKKIIGFRDLDAGLSEADLHRNFERWLVGVTHNLWRTRRRSIQRRGEVTFDAAADRPSSRTSLSSEYAWGDAMAHALKGMPSAPREVWALHVMGFKPAEIAAQLGLEANAVSVRLTRAHKYLGPRMRDALGQS